MKLDGGILEYTTIDQIGSRYNSNESPAGRKVFFLDENGYDWELELARNYFLPRQVLTVDEIYVGRSSSKVVFVEFPNKQFNTVMFEDCK